MSDEPNAQPKTNARRNLVFAGAALLMGLVIGLMVWGGLPSRADDTPDFSDMTPAGQVGSFASAGSDGDGELSVAPEKGSLAPDFTLETPEGETYRLSDLRGQAVLVNFWATWCGPCRAEMPALEATYQARRDDGFIVLGVDHTATDTVPAVIAFRDEYGLTFPLLIDPGSEVNTQYRVRAYPSSFVVNAEGVIEVVHFGPMTEDQLEGYVNAALD